MKNTIAFFLVLMAFLIVGFGMYCAYVEKNEDADELQKINDEESGKPTDDEFSNKLFEDNQPAEKNIGRNSSIEQEKLFTENKTGDGLKLNPKSSANGDQEKGSAHELKLNILNKKLSELPLTCQVVLKNNFRLARRNQILVRKKGHSFSLKIQGNQFGRFDIRIPGFGYAGNRTIPSKPINVLDIRLKAGGSIRGIVVGLDGLPVSNAKVMLKTQMPGPRDRSSPIFVASLLKTTTDIKGHFFLKSIQPTCYRLCIEYEDYALHEQLIIISRSSLKTVRITLKKGFFLKGIVYDHKDAVVPNAKILIKRPRPYFSFEDEKSLSREIMADSKGRFTVKGLTSGDYVLGTQINGVGHLNDESFTIEDGSIENYELVLEKSLQIKGKVVDPKGDPVGGLQLNIYEDATDQFDMDSFRFGGGKVVTNDKGEFTFNHLDDYDYLIYAASKHYQFVNESEVDVGVGVKDLILVVKDLMSISGKVYLPSGKLAPDFTIKIKISDESFSPVYRLEKPPEGFVCFYDPEVNLKDPESVSLVAFSEGYSHGESKSYLLKGTDIKNVEIHLKENIAFEFDFSTIDQKKIKTVELLICHEDLWDDLPREKFKVYRLKDTGKISVGSLGIGTHIVIVKAEGYATIEKEIEVTNKTGTLNILLTHGSTLEGIVVDKNHDLVKDQKIILMRSGGSKFELSPFFDYVTYTNEKGAYYFENVLPDQYQLLILNNDINSDAVEKYDFNEGDSVQILRDGAYTQELEVVKNLWLNISGFIQGSKGEVLSGDVYFTDSINFKDWYSDKVKLKGDGAFEIKNIKSGQYTLRFVLKNNEDDLVKIIKVDVNEDQENNFNLIVNLQKKSGSIVSHEGELLSGAVFVLDANRISNGLSLLDLFTNMISINKIKKGRFSFTVPEEKHLDFYFIFKESNNSAYYIKNVPIEEIALSTWSIRTPKTRELSVILKDEMGKELEDVLVQLYDEKGIPLFSEKAWHDLENLLKYIPLNDSRVHFYKKGYAVTKVKISKENTSELEVILKTGFDINFFVNGNGKYIVSLLDESKQKINLPVDWKDVDKQFEDIHLLVSIGLGKKYYKNYLPGKYYIKLINVKTKVEKISDVINIIDSNVDVMMRGP